VRVCVTVNSYLSLNNCLSISLCLSHSLSVSLISMNSALVVSVFAFIRVTGARFNGGLSPEVILATNP